MFVSIILEHKTENNFSTYTAQQPWSAHERGLKLRRSHFSGDTRMEGGRWVVTPDLDMVGGGGGLQIFVRGTWWRMVVPVLFILKNTQTF